MNYRLEYKLNDRDDTHTVLFNSFWEAMNYINRFLPLNRDETKRRSYRIVHSKFGVMRVAEKGHSAYEAQ